MQEKKLFRIKDNEGFFEPQAPFTYIENEVIGYLYNNEKECLCLTTISKANLIATNEKPGN